MDHAPRHGWQLESARGQGPRAERAPSEDWVDAGSGSDMVGVWVGVGVGVGVGVRVRVGVAVGVPLGLGLGLGSGVGLGAGVGAGVGRLVRGLGLGSWGEVGLRFASIPLPPWVEKLGEALFRYVASRFPVALEILCLLARRVR